MTQPCDSCSQPSDEPTCVRCQAEQGRLANYPVWSNGSDQREAGQRHQQRIAETRQHLTELPDLYALLPTFRLPGSAPQDPDGKRSKSNPAHRSIVNLDVLDLTDLRQKADAEDTRTDFDVDRRAGARRQGVVNTLAAWSRLVDEGLREQGQESDLAEEPTAVSECGYLLKHLVWIAEQPWFDAELHADVRRIREDVRRAVGDRDAVQITCRYCRNYVYPVDASDHETAWEVCAHVLCVGCGFKYQLGAELDALTRVQKSKTLEEVSATLHIPAPTLYRWWRQRVFDVAPDSPKRPSNRKPALFDLATVREQTALLRTA